MKQDEKFTKSEKTERQNEPTCRSLLVYHKKISKAIASFPLWITCNLLLIIRKIKGFGTKKNKLH
jgi:hypothetical protein